MIRNEGASLSIPADLHFTWSLFTSSIFRISLWILAPVQVTVRREAKDLIVSDLLATGPEGCELRFIQTNRKVNFRIKGETRIRVCFPSAPQSSQVGS